MDPYHTKFRAPVLILIFCIFFALLGALITRGSSADPFVVGSRWLGEYTCRQGRTQLELSILENEAGKITAIFNFAHAPTAVTGSFYLSGFYNGAAQSLDLAPGDWISRPTNYVAVGMRGKVRVHPLRYEGSITSPGCRDFRVVLKE